MPQYISKRQLYWLVLSFNLGSAIILMPGIITNTAAQDGWIALNIGALISMPALAAAAKLSRLYPDLSFVGYSKKIAGRLPGSVIGVLWCMFALALAVLVLRNFSDFFRIYMLPHTPNLAINSVMLFTIVMALYLGVEVLARVCQLLTPAVLVLYVVVTLPMIHCFEAANFLPMFHIGIDKIAWGSIQAVAFPFGETVLFAGLLVHLQDKTRCQKVLFAGVLSGAAFLTLGLLRTLAALGTDTTVRHYYAVVEPLRSVGFNGLEIVVVANWFCFAFLKIAVCMFAFCRGLADLVDSADYKFFTVPAGIIVVTLAELVFDNISENVVFVNYCWPLIALPVEVLLPLMLLAAAVLKKKAG